MSFQELLSDARAVLKSHATCLQSFGPEHQAVGGNTGIEECLVGQHMRLMKKLNYHIYTTSSTNEPSNPNFQEMFVGFYAPLPLILKVCDYFHDRRDYYYIVVDEANKYTVQGKVIDHKESVVCDISRLEDKGEFPDGLLPTYGGLFKGADRLHYMVIEDFRKSRRNLYKILLKIIRNSGI